MLLAIAVIVLLNVGKKEGKSTLAAIMLAVVSSVGNGVIDFAIKIQQYNTPGENSHSCFFFGYLQMRKRFTKRELISLLICAAAIACQYFNLA